MGEVGISVGIAVAVSVGVVFGAAVFVGVGVSVNGGVFVGVSVGATVGVTVAVTDALHVALPPLISRPLITATTRADTLDLFFSELAATPVTWYDGAILTITLRVNQMESNMPVMTTVAFDQSVIPSLGSATGASIPVQAEDGLVQIVPVATTEWLYLPLVASE